MRISDWSSDVCSSDLGACSARSWLQSASISSATRVARPVKVPWPNAMCLISTVTLLSGATRMKALGAKTPSAAAVSAAAAILLPPAKAKPMTRPAPAAAEALRNCRRLAGRTAGVVLESFASMGSGLHELGRLVHGGADANVGGAAADVAAHGVVDVLVARLRVVAEQRDGRHHLARLAVAAQIGRAHV